MYGTHRKSKSLLGPDYNLTREIILKHFIERACGWLVSLDSTLPNPYMVPFLPLLLYNPLGLIYEHVLLSYILANMNFELEHKEWRALLILREDERSVFR